MNLVLSTGSWFSRFWHSFLDHFIEKIIPGGNIGEEISHGILQVKEYFTIGGQQFVITDATIVSWIAIAIIIVLFAIAIRKKEMIPGKGQTIVEFLIELIISSAEGFGLSKEQAESIAPMIGTFGMVILSCNVISWFHVSPPAKNIAFPVALALLAIVYVIITSIRMVGIKGFWGSLKSPMVAMVPFKILDYIIKPISLSLRLFGNVFGAFIFMEFLSIVTPIIFPAIFGLWFDLIDGMLQAVVFAYLLMSYIGEVVEGAHEAEILDKEKKEKKAQKKALKEQQKQEALELAQKQTAAAAVENN